MFVTGLFTQYLIFRMFGMMFKQPASNISADIYCCRQVKVSEAVTYQCHVKHNVLKPGNVG